MNLILLCVWISSFPCSSEIFRLEVSLKNIRTTELDQTKTPFNLALMSHTITTRCFRERPQFCPLFCCLASIQSVTAFDNEDVHPLSPVMGNWTWRSSRIYTAPPPGPSEVQMEPQAQAHAWPLGASPNPYRSRRLDSRYPRCPKHAGHPTRSVNVERCHTSIYRAPEQFKFGLKASGPLRTEYSLPVGWGLERRTLTSTKKGLRYAQASIGPSCQFPLGAVQALTQILQLKLGTVPCLGLLPLRQPQGLEYFH